MKLNHERIRNPSNPLHSRCLALNCSRVFPRQDEENDVYKRDFSAPTLEDHFNKTILPKVMQVGPASLFTLCSFLLMAEDKATSYSGAVARARFLLLRFLSRSETDALDLSAVWFGFALYIINQTHTHTHKKSLLK